MAKQITNPTERKNIARRASGPSAAEMADRPVTRYWLQMTTGKLHTRRNCGVTSKTRYDHAYVDLTPLEAAQYAKCKKCFPEYTYAEAAAIENAVTHS